MNKHQRWLKGFFKARKVLRILRGANPRYIDDYSDDSHMAHKLLHTRKPCSCLGCSKPKKHRELTRQEIQSKIDLLEESKDKYVY